MVSLEKVPPHQILQHLIESNPNTKDKVLRIFNDSENYLVAILKGRLPIIKEDAQDLADLFRVDKSLFLN